MKTFSQQTMSGYLMVSPSVLFMAVGLAAPLAFMILISFWTQSDFVLTPSITASHYATVAQNAIYLKLFLRTVEVACITTLVTVVLAFPVAYFLAFYVERNKTVWIVATTLPFWISYLLRIFSWKVILGYNGIINSGLIWAGVITHPLESLLYNVNAVVITLSHSWAAFAVLPIYVSLEKIDRSLIEAAADLGEAAVMRFARVILPLAMPGVLAASLLVFIPVAADFVTPKLVGGVDGVMIGSIINTYFGPANDWPLGAALSVASIAGFGLIIGCNVLTLSLIRRVLA